MLGNVSVNHFDEVMKSMEKQGFCERLLVSAAMLIMRLIKKAGICIAGIALFLILSLVFEYIDNNLIEVPITSENYETYDKKELNDRQERELWRFLLLYLPVIFALMGLLIGCLDRSKHRVWLAAFGWLAFLVPFTSSTSLFNFTDSFSPLFKSLGGFIILIFYCAIAWTTAYFAPVKSEYVNEYVKVDVKLMKRVGICVLGIALSFVLVAVSVQIDVNWIEAYEVVSQKTHDEEGYARMIRLVWRFENYYRPLIFALVGLIIGILDRSKYRMKLVVISLLPFAMRFCRPGTDSLYFPVYEFVIVIIYYAIALVMSYSVSSIHRGWKHVRTRMVID